MRFWPKGKINTPARLQIDALECGAVCLGIILEYYGCPIDSYALRKACGVSRRGSDALSLIEAAHTFNMEAKAQRLPVSLLNELPLPAILFWHSSHFVVFEGRRGRWFFINDPSLGKYRLHEKEFRKNYSGVALSLTPTPEMGRKCPKRQIKPHLLSWPFVFATACAILLTCLFLIAVMGLTLFLDQVVLLGQVQWTLVFCGFCFLSILFVLVFLPFFSAPLIKYSFWSASALCATHIWHLFSLPAPYFYARPPLILEAHLFDLSDNYNDWIWAQIRLYMSGTCLIIGWLFLFFLFGPVALFILAFFVLMGFIFVFFQRPLDEHLASLKIASHLLFSLQLRAFYNFESLLLMGGEKSLSQRFSQELSALLNKTLMQKCHQALFWALGKCTEFIFLLFVFILAIPAVQNGSLSIGLFLACLLISLMLATCLQDLINDLNLKYWSQGVLHFSEDLFAHQNDTDLKPVLGQKKSSALLSLEEVTFSYEAQEKPIFEKLSFSIEAGHFVGIWGASRSGKTTLFKIMAGLLTPQKGCVSGSENSSHNELIMAYLDHRPRFVNQSLKDNLTLWDTQISADALVSVLRDLDLYECVMSRDKGLFTPMGDQGSSFSQGELQRLELARALLRKPGLLILDEALEALDQKQAHQVLSYLKNQGMTVVMGSNDPKHLILCDQVWQIKDGNLGFFK